MEFLGHMDTISSVFWVAAEVFSKVVAAFHRPTSVWGCDFSTPHQCWLASVLQFSMFAKHYLIAVLICISICMVRPFSCAYWLLLYLWRSISLDLWLVFIIELFIILLLKCKNVLHMVGKSPFSNIWLSNIHSFWEFTFSPFQWTNLQHKGF